MKWQQDLTYDIRINNDLDNQDWPFNSSGSWEEISPENLNVLRSKFLNIKDACKAILEIGVNRESNKKTFTSIFLENKKPETIYIGIDIDDKSYLNNKENNIYTIKSSSSDYDFCLKMIKSINVYEFDFIFIDGWHSINQVLDDWEYTNLLSRNGIVGFHDTEYHPGPKYFLKALNTDIWKVEHNLIKNPNDWGIGFATRK